MGGNFAGEVKRYNITNYSEILAEVGNGQQATGNG
jgi:hypothetical protein